MVLRKQPPPHLENLSKWNARSESHSPASPPASSASSPQHRTRLNRIHSQESVYSPDLNTSPAFDLMPLEEAQRSPVGSPSSHPHTSWTDGLEKRSDRDRPGALEGSSKERADSEGHGAPSVPALDPQLGVPENGWPASPEAHDASAGELPVQLQSNNPYSMPRPPEPDWETSGRNEWDVQDSHATSSSDQLSQTEGYIPMTARLSLLDPSEQESPLVELPSAVQHPAPDDHQPLQSSWTSQHSMNVSAPQETYLQGAQSNPYAPTVIVQSSDVSTEDSHGYGQQDQPPHHLRRPGSEAGINTPSATVSSATSATSHELTELDVPSTLAGETELDRPASSVYSSDRADAKVEKVLSELPAPEPTAEEARQLNDAAETQPPRPRSSSGISAIGTARQKEQRSETYSIRHVNRMHQSGQLVESPVLVQNQNGPCPLLALINALVLLANPKAPPPIVKALQTREHISLGLLIEALFEELTTSLRPDDEFPDIEALTQFLTMLHTGMNVNPRLTLESVDSVGTFLQTSDLRQYSTFGVPLIHGWLASWSSPVHLAMTRVAQYHEDIQLLHFRKQELEDRVLRGESLSPEEERRMEDIQTIQRFVEIENATQLTPFGLAQLAAQLAPGSVSILFRNDHFSTLYKHPQSHQLFTLVTDAGYASHAEVVWESLVDVTGFDTEYLSGDFRPVGHGPSGTTGPAGPRTSSTAAGRAPASSEEPKGALSPQEQSDADYAYALSLQFQEEERRENARDRHSRDRRPSAPLQPAGRPSPRMSNPPHRSSSVANGPPTMPQPHHEPDADDPNAPPPPYEIAANRPQYSPPPRGAPVDVPHGGRYPGNRASRGQYPSRQFDRNKDCIMM